MNQIDVQIPVLPPCTNQTHGCKTLTPLLIKEGDTFGGAPNKVFSKVVNLQYIWVFKEDSLDFFCVVVDVFRNEEPFSKQSI